MARRKDSKANQASGAWQQEEAGATEGAETKQARQDKLKLSEVAGGEQVLWTIRLNAVNTRVALTLITRLEPEA